MASPTPIEPALAGERNQGARATPRLQTKINPSSGETRYSFMETPVEMQRGVFHQFSSPTNSTIDESPISPSSPSRVLPSYPRGTASPMPEEKAQAQSPVEIHPAFFAPYKDQTLVLQRGPQHAEQQTVPSSPGPIPIKTHQVIPFSPAPVASVETPHIPENQEPKVGIDRRETYNPDSLQGPNGGLENHRPGQVAHPNSTIDPRWKHDLCEPDLLCCTGLVCPCMVYGKTMYRLSQKAQKQDPTDLLGYESCNGSCGLMAVACGFQCTGCLPLYSVSLLSADFVPGILAAIHRTRIRKLYKLEGSFGSDCITSCCCCCCVVMQNEREVRDREQLIRQHAGPASAAYVAPGTMTYAPPPR